MSVNNNKKEVEFIVKSDNINTITNDLYKKNLIKNRIVFKIYLDIFNVKKIKKGNYILSKSMNVKQIVEVLTRNEE